MKELLRNLQQRKLLGAGGEDARPAEMNAARLLEITESAHDMVATFDLRGRILYLNKAGLDLLGIDELTETNRHLERYMSVPTTLRLVEGLHVALEQGYWQDESEWVSAGGEHLITSQTVVAHAAEGGDEPYFSTIVRDISDRKEIERQLVLAKQAADEANEAKSAFLARVGHEIRTPLSGIIGLTHLLLRSPVTDVQRDYLRQISASSNNLLHFLNDLLDYSKLEAGQLAFEQAPFRLEDSLERLSGTFAVLLGPKAVDLTIWTEPDVPQVLIGDHVRLEQILLNMTANSIKFTEQGNVSLHVEFAGTRDAEAWIRFTIADTGIGMTPEQQTALFQPYRQADEHTSRNYGGTGLGLVICRSLIERMGGGDIRVRSSLGEGSSFTFELPFRTLDSAAFDDRPQLGQRVLVLEDNPAMRSHWVNVLKSLGCRAEAVENWALAKKRLADKPWDLLVVDMECGDMHGEFTWDEWKNEADARGVPVVCSTTLPGRDALEALPDDRKPAGVLVKPAARPQILQTFRHLKERTARSEVAGAYLAKPSSRFAGHVLVVDDSAVNRNIAKAMLESHGIETATAEHGAEAIRLLGQRGFDLILMDLNMSGMGGLEAARRIRRESRWNAVKIAAMSAEPETHIRSLCLQAGMDDVLSKPLDPEALRRLLSRWLPDAARSGAGAKHEPSPLTWPDTDALDIPLALHRLDGKVALYLRLLEHFAVEYSTLSTRLHAALEHGDASEAQRLLHSFRGAAAHLGAVPVAREALLLEESIRLGEPPASAFEQLEQRLLELLSVIETIMRQKSG